MTPTPSPDRTPGDRLAAKEKDVVVGTTAQASSLAGEAKAAAKDLGDRAKEGVDQAASHLRDMAEDRKSVAADRFKGYAGVIHRAAEAFDDEMPMVADLARKAAGEIDHLADTVRDRDLGDLVGVVHDYARRQPAVFLGATALAGFIAARFLTTSAQRSHERSYAEGGSARRDEQLVPRPVSSGRSLS